jgi:hypothetical protein
MPGKGEGAKLGKGVGRREKEGNITLQRTA